MGYKPVSLSENVNVSQRMPLRSVLLMLGGLFVVLPALFLVIVLMVGAAAPYVPAAWERSMGDDLREELAVDAL
ncbi:MAG: hypothetical protein KKB70_10310, partial [Proteobacteria bacterium]|nr:hypothetical protein [Pseudomonadota bacterium]